MKEKRCTMATKTFCTWRWSRPISPLQMSYMTKQHDSMTSSYDLPASSSYLHLISLLRLCIFSLPFYFFSFFSSLSHRSRICWALTEHWQKDWEVCYYPLHSFLHSFFLASTPHHTTTIEMFISPKIVMVINSILYCDNVLSLKTTNVTWSWL